MGLYISLTNYFYGIYFTHALKKSFNTTEQNIVEKDPFLREACWVYYFLQRYIWSKF